MENMPVILVHGVKPPVNSDVEERYHKWYDEVYTPIIMRHPGILVSLRYRIVNESPEYPKDLDIRYFKSLEGYEELYNSPDAATIIKDLATTWPKHGREVIWEPVYQVMLSFKIDTIDFSKENREENLILNVKAFKFSAVEWEKFNLWFSDYGYRAYLPLFLQVTGLRECTCYKWTGAVRPAAKVKEYPVFLLLSYFANQDACQSFETGPELAAFQGAIKLGFPNGFASQWNVTYQLVKSFRK